MARESRQSTGAKPPPTAAEERLADALHADVHALAVAIGERNLDHYDRLCDAREYIEQRFRAFGYAPERQDLLVRGKVCSNVVAEVPGRPGGEIVVLGAHYDSVGGSPGANDNGSGVAALLALAERLRQAAVGRTLRFVAFVNEEPPYFQTEAMGSVVYAKACKEKGERVSAMFSLETVGYYDDRPNSQRYPVPGLNFLYPTTGSFIGFVANRPSKSLLDVMLKSFRSHTDLPCHGAALPESIPGVGWSDHWAFWQQGYPAIEVTDTAPFRYPHYHRATDLPEHLDYARMAKLVNGFDGVLRELAGDAKP